MTALDTTPPTGASDPIASEDFDRVAAPDLGSIEQDLVPAEHDPLSLEHDLVSVEHVSVGPGHVRVEHDLVSLEHDPVSLEHDLVSVEHVSVRPGHIPVEHDLVSLETGGRAARIYFATTSHRRNSNAPGAVARTFTYSTCYWLVDVDDLPVLPRPLRPFTQFAARDHLGDPSAGLADNARAVLSENDLWADRILLLTCPRVAGHVFNPLSVFYCFATRDDTTAELIAVIAEVHNTYGGRHVYLMRPDESGRDSTEKAFYVSPFLPMGGTYLMRTPVPGDKLAVSIALRQGGQTPFVATLSGRGRAVSTRSVLTSLIRWPLLTLRTSALIRWQGIRLWLRRVPVQPRPKDATLAEHDR